MAAVPRETLKFMKGSHSMAKHWLSGVTLVAALAFSGVAHAQIKMGVATAITGPNAAFGTDMVNGAQQAVDDINKAGGILGQPITLERGDDAADPKQGVSVANKFVGDGVKLVVGHLTSGVTIPASEVYSEHGILMITPAATNPKVTDRGLWDVFRTSGRDDQQGRLWAELAQEDRGPPRQHNIRQGSGRRRTRQHA
jgi:branched-chain amino acid transport system substrate-binding protein